MQEYLPPGAWGCRQKIKSAKIRILQISSDRPIQVARVPKIIQEWLEEEQQEDEEGERMAGGEGGVAGWWGGGGGRGEV